MKLRSLLGLFLCSTGLTLAASALAAAPVRLLRTKHVFLITADGLRWQDVFGGADAALLNAEAGGVKNVEAVRAAYWRETPAARRAALLPFLWGQVVPHGQIYGNQTRASISRVTNGRNFSYPGYNEILTGHADDWIVSNDKIPNPSVTVLEWLHRRPGFAGRVAAFSAWDTLPAIINRDRCGFPVMGGWEPVPDREPNPRQALLNELIAETVRAGSTAEVYDSFLYHAAREHFLRHRPRVFMVGFLETDLWGHLGRYDHYLDAAHRIDDYIRRLWELVQSLPDYRDQTTFIITTDHGRGAPPLGWKTHGVMFPGSEATWLAVIGPDTPALGERHDVAPVTQNRIASTLAALLGEDYRAAEPRAGAALTDLLPPAP